MRRFLITIIAAFIVFGGRVAPAAAGLFSATRAVIAILDGELFVGEAEGHVDGAGTMVIRSQRNHSLSCIGEFTSSAELGGNGNMRCSDGATATFRFQRLGTFRGHGTGISSRGTMTFAYGFNAEEATLYLTLPAGKRLSPVGTELMLVDL